VVVILMGVTGTGRTAIGEALADRLGWPLVNADAPYPRDKLQATIADVLGRREHLVVTSAPLDAGAQQAARGDLRGVRFLDLADQGGDPDDIVRTIRREFGI
jgi:hypothetical protein